MQNILDLCNEKMNQAITVYENHLMTVRTGVANAGMLNDIHVSYYGSLTPLNQISSISVSEGKTLVIKPYDSSSLKDIEKAIAESNIGLPTNNDGTVVRINVPALTEETRKGYCKTVLKFAEDAKVAIRNVRRDANDHAKADKNLTEDLQKNCLEKVQKITDEHIKLVDEKAKAKEKEIMTI